MATVNRGQAITVEDIGALVAAANLKLTPATAYSFTTANWLSEMNRIRTDLWARYIGGIGDFPPAPVVYGSTKILRGWLTDGHPPGFSLQRLKTVSGPWVVKSIAHKNTGAQGGTLSPDSEWDWSDVEYWYASGLTPNLRMSTVFANGGTGESINVSLGNELDNLATDGFYPTYKSYIRIGGTLDGVFTTGGVFGIPAGSISVRARQRIANTNHSGLAVTTDIPGVSISYDGFEGAVITLPAGNISPGLYTLEATVNSDWGFASGTGDGFGAVGMKFTCTPEYDDRVIQKAIEQSGAVLRVRGHQDGVSESGGWPFGIHLTSTPGSSELQFTRVDVVTGERFDSGDGTANPSVSLAQYLVSTNIWQVDCEGLFVAKTIPVDRENTEIDLVVPYEAMRGQAPHFDTATVKAVTPAVNYRVGRYPCTKDADDPPGWTIAAGMCVYAVTVRRLSVDAGSGIDLPPATKPEMSVDIGYYVSGSMHVLDTVVIPANAMDATIYPFWPVFGPIGMRYAVQGDPTADAVVQVYANYQTPYMGTANSLNPNATYPISSCLYNDLWNALGNLPDPP